MLAQAKTKKEYKKLMAEMLNSIDSESEDEKYSASSIKTVDLAYDTTSGFYEMLRPVKHNFLKTDSTAPTVLGETLVECLPGYYNSDQSSSTSTMINERTLPFSITKKFEKYEEEKEEF
ncbi:hypothetical protein Godav_027771 [Gossypium davidsonii]|uniref:Uncharacterized protein n=1 Tax=Gossypium davidsonii TaxID=34287 RepID=A0A7J8RWZ7_GOSDV|nr:hypothetical protein [Gossypium davidsonii]